MSKKGESAGAKIFKKNPVWHFSQQAIGDILSTFDFSFHLLVDELINVGSKSRVWENVNKYKGLCDIFVTFIE